MLRHSFQRSCLPHATFRRALPGFDQLPLVSLSRGSCSCSHNSEPKWRRTTILCVRKGPKVIMVGDGQVSMGNIVYKPNVCKVRLIDDGRVLTGIAGGTADAVALLEILEGKLSEFPGQLKRACVEMAKEWRKDKFMRRYEAQLVVADSKLSLLLSGQGDVFEPHDDILAIGSGAPYATAAARAQNARDVPESRRAHGGTPVTIQQLG
eukprot:1087867_1